MLDKRLLDEKIRVGGRQISVYAYILGQLLDEAEQNYTDEQVEQLMQKYPDPKYRNTSTYRKNILRGALLNNLLKKGYINTAGFLLADIAYILNISVERVRQLELGAIKKLRSPAFKDIIQKIREYKHMLQEQQALQSSEELI